MSNPRQILETLDRNLSSSTELTIFGRAALALGFPNSPREFASTRDVDAILPLQWLSAADENVDFWLAQQKTNDDLAPSGLYLTHLFRELEVILRPGWYSERVPIDLSLQKLSVSRPATIDFILTKMARADDTDLRDIRFMIEAEHIAPSDLATAFTQARVPDVAEIQVLFQMAQPKVLAIARDVPHR